VSLSLLLRQEETRRFNYVLSTYSVPLQVGRIALSRYTDVLAVDNQLALLYVSFDSTFEVTVHRVILEHVSQVVNGAEVVDTYNLDVAASLSGAEYETADTTETVNTYFNHILLNFKWLIFPWWDSCAPAREMDEPAMRRHTTRGGQQPASLFAPAKIQNHFRSATIIDKNMEQK
jgi:hypothetical protein